MKIVNVNNKIVQKFPKNLNSILLLL